ncbi:LANO_0A03576g1_1 [Lachancea nothofagi CBS 11611]|uniref:LANO_0A03576g1_1 n=1 Tax=Lachancea nothofagi CBS 11611 TaxID=1266666 RepID=A0A1G4IPL3_9SACH|nr:LANO_0A03576g1_1 [Lachancea nothofagi CBS 11611]
MSEVNGHNFPSNVEWFAEGTKMILFNGETIKVEELIPGSQLLWADGSYRFIDDVFRANDNLYHLTQYTKHRAHKLDPSRPEPFGVFRMVCFERAVLSLQTGIHARVSYDKRRDVKLLRFSKLRDHLTDNGRVIKMLKWTEESFPVDTPNSVLVDLVKKFREATGKKFVEWECEIGDLKYLINDIRASTRLLLYPIPFEIPTLKPWLQRTFEREVSDRELEAMSWMLGFWIGDGCRAGALFALNMEDNDVNGMLEENAKIWGMSYEKRKYANSGLSAFAALHTPKADGKGRNWNVKNPFVAVLRGLKFYKNGLLNGPKNIPEFMRVDQLLVRKCFMAGLIDSDGYSSVADDFLSAKVSSVYPPIRDGILFICRSLGLNVSVSFCPAHRDEKRGINEADIWNFLITSGTNRGILLSILQRCSHGRKKDPPIFHYNKTPSNEADAYARRPKRYLNLSEPISNLENESISDKSMTGSTAVDDVSFSECENEFDSNTEIEQEQTVSETGFGCFDLAIDLEEIQLETDLTETDPDIVELDLGLDADISKTFDEPYFENDGDRDYASFNNSRQFFKTAPMNQKGTIYGIQLKERGILTESQIVYEPPYSVGDERVPYEQVCLSCSTKDETRWTTVPWQYNVKDRLCRSCYDSYVRTNTRCSNTACNKVYHLYQLGKKAMKGQPRLKINVENGSAKHRYLCNLCGSVTVTDGAPEDAKVRKEATVESCCVVCGPKSTGRWRKFPWDKDKMWCGACSQRFLRTRIICADTNCRKIPSPSEFAKMKSLPGKPETFNCLKCKQPVTRDLSKALFVPAKSEMRTETCISCGPIAAKRWCSLPWDKKSSKLICDNCKRHYNDHGHRCLNDSCNKIFSYVQLKKMEIKKRSKPDNSEESCYVCPHCGQDTEWRP